MCGIAGIFNINGKKINNAHERISKMTNMLIHRGPDSQGVFVSPDGILALGNTRLAIVDPKCDLKQPLQSFDGNLVLTFNGEIYNYIELQEEMKNRGVNFRTRMDTEVLLEGLRLYGEHILHKLDGMWSFAYYDVLKKHLLLSRDIMGERHIFFRIDKSKGEFIFASEIKPILADSEEFFDMDSESLAASIRFFSAPPGRTLVKGIERILPGYNISASVKDGIKIYRYKRLHPEKWFDFFKSNPSLDETINTFEGVFHKACRRRLPLDVPFVSTLSGGIDSTLICVFASDFGKKRITTLFGQSYDDIKKRGDLPSEYEASKFTSQKFNTHHLFSKMNNQDCVPILKGLAQNCFDGTIDDTTAAFEMLACKVKEENFKVILVSDGPDELLGGYRVDKRAYFIDRLREKRPILYSFLRAISSFNFSKNILNSLGYSDYMPYSWTSYKPFRFRPIHESFGPDVLSEILPKEMINLSNSSFGIIDSAYNEIADQLDYSQMRGLSYASKSLPDHFNLRIDKAFLKRSIECRLPYQAPDMIEFMLAVPAKFRFNDGATSKYLMRKIVEKRVGPEISTRPKRGFSAPLFRTPAVYKKMNFEEVLRESSLFKVFPFKKGTRNLILEKNEYKKLVWPFYALSKTYECLKNRSYN